MTPVASPSNVGGKIRKIEVRPHLLQLDAICIAALVSAGTGPLDSNGDGVPSLQWHPTKLHVAEQDHSVGAPILDRVGKHVAVHEGTVLLVRAELAQLSISVPQPENRLAGLRTGAKQLELKLRFQFAILGWG